MTLFDRLFLPQGLALHSSLRRHSKDPFVLWVLCMDEHTKEVIDKLRLPSVRTIPLEEVETDSLRAVKSGRTSVEYCWTLTPFTPTIVFERETEARR
ncbi:MAG: glycosyl transferase, partial [Nitrososphaerales archaeon]